MRNHKQRRGLKMKRKLSVYEVADRYGIGVSTVWAWSKANTNGFPSPTRYGDRCTRWDEESLDEFDEKMKEAAA